MYSIAQTVAAAQGATFCVVEFGPVTPGNMLLIYLTTVQPTGPVTVTDTSGNTWHFQYHSLEKSGWAWAFNVGAGSPTVTITGDLDPTVGEPAFGVEIAGCPAGIALDASRQGSNSIFTSYDNDIIFAVGGAEVSCPGPVTGITPGTESTGLGSGFFVAENCGDSGYGVLGAVVLEYQTGPSGDYSFTCSATGGPNLAFGVGDIIAFGPAPGPSLSCTLSVSPDTTRLGGTVTLSWISTGAVSAMLYPLGISVPVNGSMEVVVSGTPIELVITDADGDTSSCSLTVPIPGTGGGGPPPPPPFPGACPALEPSVWPCEPAIVAIDNNAIIGIPKAAREPVVNVVRFRLDVNNDDTQSNVSSRQYKGTWTFWQQDSIDQYQQQFIQQIESQGLLAARGGMMRASVLADRIFRRHAFGTPAYTFTAFLSYINMELGDFLSITHPKLIDFATGAWGVENIVCEIVEKHPNYAEGNVEFKVLDTRFMSMTTAWEIAVDTETVWPGTIAPTEEMFISQDNGEYSDSTPARDLF
jgi:hypothetical protein